MLREYEGRVRLVVKDFPLASHALARPAHAAARCAGQAGHFWAYHDRLYETQPHFQRADLVRSAVRLGLDEPTFVRCLESGTFAAAVEADVSQGRALGVRSTPTFFINGQMLVGAQSVDAMRRAIEAALARRR